MKLCFEVKQRPPTYYVYNDLFVGDEVAGYVSLKHVYEIALIKKQDACNELKPVKAICEDIIRNARTCGIIVQREDMKPEVYGEFLKKREAIVAEEEQRLLEVKQAKLLRMA